MQTQAAPEIVALHLETMKKEALDSIPPFPEDELLSGDAGKLDKNHPSR